MPSGSKKRKINRQYIDENLNHGFTWIGDKNCPLLLYCVCGLKFANSAMLPAKLKRHFITKHGNLNAKGKDYMETLLKTKYKEATCF